MSSIPTTTFAEVFRAFDPKLYNRLVKRAKSRLPDHLEHLAVDVVNDVLVNNYRTNKVFQSDVHATRSLMVSVRNMCIDYKRRDLRERKREADLDSSPANQFSNENSLYSSNAIEDIKKREVRKAFWQLSYLERKIILLVILRRMTQEKAAQKLGISKADVFRKKEEALKKMKAFVKSRIARNLLLALLLIGCMIGLIGKVQYSTNPPAQVITQHQQSAPHAPKPHPAINKAILTLADGQQFSLDAPGTQKIGTQGGNDIYYSGDSGFVFKPIPGCQPDNATASKSNTLVTPTGGLAHIGLAEGSQISLNVASTLSFPVRFDSIRKVDFSGEGRFEIASSSIEHKIIATPFQVRIQPLPGMEINQPIYVTALGTAFRIKAYPADSSILVTLYSGAIRIKAAKEQDMNIPGSWLIGKDGQLKPQHFDPASEKRSWKQEDFVFESMPFNRAIDELARWYNVKVVNKDKIGGVLNLCCPRTYSLDAVDSVIEGSRDSLHIHCRNGELIINR